MRRAKILKLLLTVASTFSMGYAQSIGCYVNAVCVHKLYNCACNSQTYYSDGFKAGNQGMACDLFYGPYTCGSGCSTGTVTSQTHYNGTDGCIGPEYPVFVKQPSFNASAQQLKQETQEVFAKLERHGAVSDGQCEIAEAAFRSWLQDRLKAAK